MNPEGPKQFLQTIAHQYANCASYRDSGTVTSTSYELNSERITNRSTLHFATRYRNDGRFFFEYNKSSGDFENAWDRNVIWSNGNSARSWRHRKGRVENNTLSLLIAGFTGVSRGSAHTIPVLLIPSIGGTQLTHAKEVILDPTSQDEPHTTLTLCFSSSESSFSETVTLSNSTGLIKKMEYEQIIGTPSQRDAHLTYLKERLTRNPVDPEERKRIEEQIEFQEKLRSNPPFRSHTLTVYEPEMNQPIADEEFNFEPSSS